MLPSTIRRHEGRCFHDCSRVGHVSRTNFEILGVDQELARLSTQLPASLQGVYDLWLRLADGARLPSWRDMRLDALPAELIPWAILLDVLDDGQDFRYRFYSAERASLRNRDYTDMRVSEYEPLVFRDKVMGEYRRVLEAREPMLFVTTVSVPNLHTWEDNEERQYAILRMPLSGDGGTIDRLISVDAIELVHEWQMRFRYWPSYR